MEFCFGEFRVDSRFDTLRKTIAFGSNTFYDAYLDLVETTLKLVIEKEDIEIGDFKLKGLTAGRILEMTCFKTFCKNSLNIDEKELKDLGKKVEICNKHKHNNERDTNVDIIIDFLKLFFMFINKYLLFKNMDIVNFDEEFFKDLFCKLVKENEKMKRDIEIQLNDIDKLKQDNLLSEIEIEKLNEIIKSNKQKIGNLDDENSHLKQIIDRLKDFNLSHLEEKLNQSHDLLLKLQKSLDENRLCNNVIFKSIKGRPINQGDIDRMKEEMNNGR